MNASAPRKLDQATIGEEAARLLSEADRMPERLLLGIAGIAGSGKSTLGQRLADAINTLSADAAEFVPMDGFHLPNATLDAESLRPRKGAVFTYDAEAYVGLLEHYRDLSATGGYPEYCREVHEPVPSERGVTATTKIIVTEGQYLLSPDTPWSRLADILHECWWLDVSPEQARAWLMKRDTLVGRTPQQAEAKYQSNDRLNTEYVLANRREPDRTVRWPDSSND